MRCKICDKQIEQKEFTPEKRYEDLCQECIEIIKETIREMFEDDEFKSD